MGKRAASGASGGKHASVRSSVDDYRRHIGSYEAQHSKAKYKGRHSVKSVRGDHHKRSWTLVIVSAALLLFLLTGFYAVFAVEVMEAIQRAMSMFSK